MSITIIQDCTDDNAKNRQLARLQSLTSSPISYVRVANDLEAAGNIIDTLDAVGDREHVLVVNVAPRNGSSHKWENGTPFAHFKYKNTTIISSIEGRTLSLVKKFKLVDSVTVFDIEKSLLSIGLSEVIAKHGAKSQFRSFDFLPYIASYFAMGGENIHGGSFSLSEVEDVPHSVWWIDNFGNAKTTVTPDDISFSEDESVETNFGTLLHHSMLKNVPDDQASLTIGSSGLGENRFYEMIIQGKNFAKEYNVSSGTEISFLNQ